MGNLLARNLILPVLLFAGFHGMGQDINTFFRKGMLLEETFRDAEALQAYEEVLQFQPNHLEALCKASELYSRLGKKQTGRDQQKAYYTKAREYADKALKLNPQWADANFAMAMAMGRMAMISSGESKIRAVKDIRVYALKCIQLDPSDFRGYHVLAKWHYEVSNLSSFERWLVKIVYGGLPEASLTEAIRCYEKSLQLKPSFSLNYLELAKACHKNQDNRRALSLLNQMMTLPRYMSDDPAVREEGKKLLREWSE